MTKNITILGSTGSIGTSAVRVIEAAEGAYRVRGLSCRENLSILAGQIEALHPEAVAVESAEARSGSEYRHLKETYNDVEFIEGSDCVTELAYREADISISAIVGGAGLKPSLAALESSSRVALANKETLVMAGDLFMKRAEELGTELIPVDSEHSAIFSLLEGIKRETVHKIILTASGGSLRDLPLDELPHVSIDRALAHPTWEMGKKITIDSATLMNKGLEVIEAHYLFSAEYETIGVLIHPESIIHGLVETIDGALYSHMGVADMAFPIQAALSYPEKKESFFGRLDLLQVGKLTFKEFDPRRYPGLKICYDAGKEGGTAPAVLNAANEIAVEAFLGNEIGFIEITEIVERTLQRHATVSSPDIDSIFAADVEARETAREIIRGIKK